MGLLRRAGREGLNTRLDPLGSGRKGRLRLVRPLVYLDLETTGVDPRSDRVIEVSVMKVFPPLADGSLPEPDVRTRRMNPGVPIPPGATAIHGITDEDVALLPTFAAYARSLLDFFSDCDFAGFGVRRFDLPLLVAEFKRVELKLDLTGRHCIDGKEIFHFKEPRTLTAAYALYCGGELESAHTAEADMLAARDVILAQLERYEDLPGDVAALATVGAPSADPDAFDPDGKLKWLGEDVILNFGKHRGKSLRDLTRNEDGRGVLSWMLRQDFNQVVKRAIRGALEGRLPLRGESQTPDAHENRGSGDLFGASETREVSSPGA